MTKFLQHLTANTGLALLVALALASLAGCQSGPDPKPPQYQCGTLSDNHCYARVVFGQDDCSDTDPTKPPRVHGYETHIYVAEGISGGDGFITHELWLASLENKGWLEVGYAVESDGKPYYFWAENTADDVYATHKIAFVPPEDFGQYAVCRIVNVGENTFRITLANKSGTVLDTQVHNEMWRTKGYGWATIGQELSGSRSASAVTVQFANNGRFDRTGTFNLETLNAVPIVSSPPYGDWVAKPSAGAGGTFATRCCLP